MSRRSAQRAERYLKTQNMSSSITPENVVDAMLATLASWDAVSTFAAAVMKQLRREDLSRRNEV